MWPGRARRCRADAVDTSRGSRRHRVRRLLARRFGRAPGRAIAPSRDDDCGSGATCAKLCRAAGAELEQIQMMLGHASVQTTERYLGTKQDLVHAPNDGIKLRVAV